MNGRPGGLLRGFWLPALVAGGATWTAFPPLDLGSAPAVLGWALLLLSMRLRRGKAAGRQALLAALVVFLAGLHWISPLVTAGWIFVAAWCAAFEGLFGWWVGRTLLRRDGPPHVGWVLAAPLAHLAFDLVRTVLLTGFPWLLVGYAGWRNPVLLGSADLVGVHGATLALLTLAAGLAELVARTLEGRRWWTPLLPAAGVWAACGAWALAKGPVVERPGPVVALLQADIPQRLKEQLLSSGEEPMDTEAWWRRHEELAARAREEARRRGVTVDAFVWPETMVPSVALRPFVPGETVEAVVQVDGEGRRSPLVARRVAATARGAVSLAGIQTFEPLESEADRVRKWNTVLLLGPEGAYLGHQDKQHLTPGGEYVPYLHLLPFRQALLDALEEFAGFVIDMEAGAGPRLLEVPGGSGPSRAGVLICYESAFPELSREMVAEGADWLLNASNYGWFAGTAQMEQALAMACFRSAELRRSLVLASNNGISAVIGPDGTPRAFAEDAQGRRVDVPAALVAEVPLAAGAGPFTAWGELPAWLLGAGGLLACLVLARRGRSA